MTKNTRSNDDALRAEALSLRQTGHTNLQIRATLGITGWKLTQLLQGYVAPVHAKLANRAKTELREQARELRRQGWGYPAIARKLRVSKSSLSLWLRDLPKPEKHQPNQPPADSDMTPEEWSDYCMQRAELYRQRRAEERRQEVLAAACEIGELTERELLIAGVVAYWCEGSKSKPWRRQHGLVLINSDPELIRMYLRFLAQLDCPVERLSFAVNIHENADVDAATEYWLGVTGATKDQFRKPALKRHNPQSVRLKTGEHYQGALTVYVRRSTRLYRRIEGWARAIMLGPQEVLTAIQESDKPPG